MRCSRACARVSTCSRLPRAGDTSRRDGAAMRGSGLAVAAGRCCGAAGRPATCGAGRDGAAKRGAARGAIAGRCGAGAARNAGTAGRAIAGGAAGRAAMGGGAAGRAMAGGAAGRAIAGGAAGRAMAAGGAADAPGAFGPPLPCWANELALTAIAEAPAQRNAARRRPRGSMSVSSLLRGSPANHSTRKCRDRSQNCGWRLAMLRRRGSRS